MSMDKGTMDKGGSTGEYELSDLYYLKIENGELYTISPDHVYRDDMTNQVSLSDSTIMLSGELFKVSG